MRGDVSLAIHQVPTCQRVFHRVVIFNSPSIKCLFNFYLAELCILLIKTSPFYGECLHFCSDSRGMRIFERSAYLRRALNPENTICTMHLCNSS